jgi:hypothetical protein
MVAPMALFLVSSESIIVCFTTTNANVSLPGGRAHLHQNTGDVSRCLVPEDPAFPSVTLFLSFSTRTRSSFQNVHTYTLLRRYSSRCSKSKRFPHNQHKTLDRYWKRPHRRLSAPRQSCCSSPFVQSLQTNII